MMLCINLKLCIVHDFLGAALLPLSDTYSEAGASMSNRHDVVPERRAPHNYCLSVVSSYVNVSLEAPCAPFKA